MPENNQFEYAVIRLVPKVEREEFLNVGVVLYCARQQFLQMKYKLDLDKLQLLCKQVDVEEIKQYLHAFDEISQGVRTVSPISQLPMASRFRWLTATRSTMLQISKVHPGLCSDAAKMLDKIFTEQVL